MNQRLFSVLFLLLAWRGTLLGAQNQGGPDARTNQVASRQVAQPAADATTSPLRSNAELLADPAFADVEKNYLEGKITAREFRKLIRDLRAALPTVVTPPPPVQTVKAPVVVPVPRAPSAPPPLTVPPLAVPVRKPTPDEGSGDFDLETKLNELLQKKAERERAMETKITPAELAAPATQLTKRQRLDLLLRLFVQEKIPQAEYQATREKIMALPD